MLLYVGTTYLSQCLNCFVSIIVMTNMNENLGILLFHIGETGANCNKNNIFKDCGSNCYLIETFLMTTKPQISPAHSRCINKCLMQYTFAH